MINIVHEFFRHRWHRRNTACGIRTGRIVAALALLGFAYGPPPATAEAMSRGSARACDPRLDCPGRWPPGPPARDARPFDGTLGRPCAYRWRETPSGTRKVRVCF